MKKLLVCLFAVNLAACATAPDKISSSYVNPAVYSGQSCKDLQRDYGRVTTQLSRATSKQEKAVSNDQLMVTMGMLFVWPAFFFIDGDQTAAEIADFKGKKEALEQAIYEQKC